MCKWSFFSLSTFQDRYSSLQRYIYNSKKKAIVVEQELELDYFCTRSFLGPSYFLLFSSLTVPSVSKQLSHELKLALWLTGDFKILLRDLCGLSACQRLCRRSPQSCWPWRNLSGECKHGSDNFPRRVGVLCWCVSVRMLSLRERQLRWDEDWKPADPGSFCGSPCFCVHAWNKQLISGDFLDLFLWLQHSKLRLGKDRSVGGNRSHRGKPTQPRGGPVNSI